MTVVLAAQLGQVLLSLWLPALNAAIIDDGIIAGNQRVIWVNGLIMLGAALAQIACMVGAIYAGSRTSMEFGRDLRKRIFGHVQSFSATDQHRFGAPTLITRTTNDVTQVQMVVMMTFTVMITAPIMGIGGIVMALQQDAQLSWLLAVMVPVLALIIAGVMMKLTPRFKIQQTRIDRINTLLREQLTGVRVIRAFVRQRSEREKFDGANRDLRKVGLEIGWLWSFMMPASLLVIGLSSVAVVWFGAGRINAGQMQVGALTAYITYLMMIFGAVMMGGMMAMMFPRGEVSANRLTEIELVEPSIKAPARPRALPAPGEPISFELREATIQYEGAEEPVIAGANMRVTPGATVAIIGSTGSGKSSLIRLFPRMIDAASGAVLAGGINVRDLDPRELRERIAFVPQKAFLFSGTIASNVAGLPRLAPKAARAASHIDESRVRRALEAAQAWEFVSELEDGIHAAVESGGMNFSGGQRQRLTIARAIYRCLPSSSESEHPDSTPMCTSAPADLLIFDDSFSALDFATDAALRTHLREYIGDTAVLIVAQRVSTIRYADEIHVLGDGCIEASGTHAELMDSSPTYREIVSSQLTEEEAK